MQREQRTDSREGDDGLGVEVNRSDVDVDELVLDCLDFGSGDRLFGGWAAWV